MKKFLLVIFIGIVLVINLYGIVNEIISSYEAKNTEEIHRGYTIVYME